jgi:hypothetical protein
LNAAQKAHQAIGEAWVLPALDDTAEPCSRHTLYKWWRAAESAAGLVPEHRRAWHALRRKFATELKYDPVPDDCALGGWKSAKTLAIYQQRDKATSSATRRPSAASSRAVRTFRRPERAELVTRFGHPPTRLVSSKNPA